MWLLLSADRQTQRQTDHATTVTVGRILCYAKRCGLTLETRFCRFVRSFLLHWRKQFVLSHLGSQHDATRISCWAPTPAAIAEHSAANPPAAVAAVDRQERRTDARSLHRPCSAQCAVSYSMITCLFMYVGLFVHSAAVFNVSKNVFHVFKMFYRPTDCAVVFYEWHCIIHWLIVLYWSIQL